MVQKQNGDCSVNSALLNVLKNFEKIRTIKNLHIMTFILEEVCIEERKIAEKYRLSFKNLQKHISELVDLRFIKRMRDKEGNVFIIIHKQFNDPDYTDEYSIMLKKAWDMVSENAKEVECVESLRGHIREKEETVSVILNWKIKHFTSFFFKMYDKKFFHVMVKPNKIIVKKIFQDISLKFKQKYGNTYWKVIFKQYIKWWIKSFAMSKTTPRINDFSNPIFVDKFCKEKGLRIFSMDICVTKGIYCPYFENDKCSLGDSNMICTTKFFKKMRNKYN